MAVKFYNIISEQYIVADSEEHVAALYNSSDKTINAAQGQDRGWRIDPVLAVRLNRAMNDPRILQEIAAVNQTNVSDIKEYQVLTYITRSTSIENVETPRPEDFEDSYRKMVAKAEAQLDKMERSLEESGPKEAKKPKK